MADTTESTTTETTSPAPSPIAAAVAQFRAAAETPAEAEAPVVEEETTGEETDGADIVTDEADDDAGDEAPAGDEDGEQETEEEAGEEEATGEPYVLKLPGRGPDDPDTDLELDGLTRDQQEAIARLRKGYLRREHLNSELAEVNRDRQEIATDRAELDEIEQGLATDPASWILGRVKDRAVVTDIALDHLVSLLEDDSKEGRAAYQEFVDQLAELEENPTKRENRILKRKQAAPAKQEKPAAAATDEGPIDGIVSQDPEVTKVLTHLRAVVPQGASPARARAYMELALAAVHEHMIEEGIEDAITAEDLDAITADVRRTFRFGNPGAADRRGTSTGANGDSAPAPRKAAPAQKDPRETGKRLANAAVRRREAATVPAGGASPPAAPTPLPRGGGIKEALAALRKNGD